MYYQQFESMYQVLVELNQFCKPCKNDHVSLPAILEENGIVGVEEAAEDTGAGAACMHIGTTTSIPLAMPAGHQLFCSAGFQPGGVQVLLANTVPLKHKLAGPGTSAMARLTMTWKILRWNISWGGIVEC